MDADPPPQGVKIARRVTPTSGVGRMSQRDPANGALTPGRSARRRTNFIAMFWRGEFSLGVSYWGFGLLVSLLAAALVVAVSYAAPRAFNPLGIFASLMTVWCGLAALTVWQMVGVWRSASRHARERQRLGRTTFWARAAQVAIVIGTLRSVAALLNAGVPQLTEAARMAFLNDPDIPSYRLTLLGDGSGVGISGGFKFGLSKELDQLLNAAPQVRYIQLSSLGGRMGEAEEVFDLIRRYGLSTYVRDECTSACVIAFAGGSQRWIGRFGKLGLHSPDFPGMSDEELQTMRDKYAATLTSTGFDRTFVQRGMSVPPEKVWYPTADELLRAGAITGVARDDQFPASEGAIANPTGVPSGTSRQQISELLLSQYEFYRILQRKFPKDFDRLLNSVVAAMQSDLTEEQIISLVFDQVASLRKLYAASIVRAPDREIRTALEYIVELHESVLEKSGYTVCNKLAVQGPIALAGYQSYEGQLNDVASSILNTIAASLDRPEDREKATDKDWAALRNTMERNGVPQRYFDALADQKADDRDLCPALITFMKAMLAMRGARGARLRADFVSMTSAQ